VTRHLFAKVDHPRVAQPYITERSFQPIAVALAFGRGRVVRPVHPQQERIPLALKVEYVCVARIGERYRRDEVPTP
jgi:hypothetical protein